MNALRHQLYWNCSTLRRFYSTMDLSSVVSVFESLAPTRLAGSWDNVGLLVEPPAPLSVKSILLTNDLTEDVLDEALKRECNVILSYHPPIFSALKRITQSHWKQRIVATCLANSIAVYSPHTAFDAVQNGVNDWLLEAFGEVARKEAVECCSAGGQGYTLQVTCSPQDSSTVVPKLAQCQGVSNLLISGCETVKNEARLRVSADVSRAAAAEALETLSGMPTSLVSHSQVKDKSQGSGRRAELQDSISIDAAVESIKKHLGLERVRLALGRGKNQESQVGSVAVCAGSGGSVLAGVGADLLLTGEMSHHEVLEHVAHSRTVVLCDHSNTERGFLSRRIQPLLTDRLGGDVEVLVSKLDRDPLEIV